jgi:single-strand DNA-binding protein
MLNKVFLIGRLTRDPEIRFLPSGTQVTTFSIAYNRNYKVNDEWKEEPHYFDIEAFGQLAERLGKQLSKGVQILIEGRLRHDKWESASGEKRSKVVIVAEKVSIISRPRSEGYSQEPVEEDLGIPNAEPENFNSDEDIPF